MFSRFITWQEGQVDYTQDDFTQSYFVIKCECIDVRFNLHGYGFKKIYETNRINYHPGKYRCEIRKLGSGDPFKVFANVVCERAPSDSPNVYKDVSVSTGVLEEGHYEIYVYATNYREMYGWTVVGESVIENLQDYDNNIPYYEQYWYDLQVRAIKPLLLRAIDEVDVNEFANQGLDPLPLYVLDPNPIFYFDPIQAFDYLKAIALEHNIYGISELFTVTDVLTIQYDYDLPVSEAVSVSEFQYTLIPILPFIKFDVVNVQDVVTANIPDYNTVSDFVHIQDVVTINVAFTIFAFDTITHTEDAEANRPRFRAVSDDISVQSNFAVLDIVGVIENAYDYISIIDNLVVNIYGSTYPTPFDSVGVFESFTGLLSHLIVVNETLNVNEFRFVNIFGNTSVNDTISITENSSVSIGRSLFVFDSVSISEFKFLDLPVVVVAEGVTVTENAKISLLSPSVIQGITILENVSARLAWRAVVSDNIVVNEQTYQNFRLNAIVQDIINIAEFVQATNLNFSVFEFTNVFEDVSLVRTPVFIFVSDNVAISEVYRVEIPILYIPAFAEIINVDEFIEVSCPNFIKREDISVLEIIAVQLPILNLRNKFDNIIVFEAKTISLSVLHLSVFSTVAVTDFVLAGGLLAVDNIAVNDNLVIEIAPREESTATDEAGVNGALFDTITASEFVSLVRVVEVKFIKAEFITVSEDVTLKRDRVISDAFDEAGVNGALFDSIAISEFVSLLRITTYLVSEFEPISIQEVRIVKVDNAISRSDSVSVSESATASVPSFNLYEESSVNGALFDMIAVQEFLTIGVI